MTEKTDKEFESKKIEIKPQKEQKKTQKTKTAKAKDSKQKRMEADISLLKKENKKLKDDYLRQIADKENLRKRLDREKTEFYQYALSESLRELLVVLDNFERAMESDDNKDSKNFYVGIELIYKQFQDVLVKLGLEPVKIEDGKFDPNSHQALITEESEDIEVTTVSEELQRGYRLHNRLLRPTLVKVLVPKKELQ